MTAVTLDVPGAADMLKVHPETVLDMIAKGVLPAAKVGRAWVLLSKDVLAHIENEIIRQTAARMGSSRAAAPVSRRRRRSTLGAL